MNEEKTQYISNDLKSVVAENEIEYEAAYKDFKQSITKILESINADEISYGAHSFMQLLSIEINMPSAIESYNKMKKLMGANWE